MSAKRRIEVFTAGCPVCEQTIKLVRKAACPSCEIRVLDMHDPEVSRRASSLGIRSIPTVVVDGTLADCCTAVGPELATLRLAGLEQPQTSTSH